MTPDRYSEDELVEQPAIALFEELGWEHINAYHETLGPDGTLGRDNKSEVFLTGRLQAGDRAPQPRRCRVRPIDDAVNEITKPRTAMHYARANAEIHALLRDRVEVSVRQPDGTTLPEKLTVIDWEQPENNDFLLVSQLWVHSDLYKRRADLVGFVNGIPLVFIELKASHRTSSTPTTTTSATTATRSHTSSSPNGFIILSNGAETKVGTDHLGLGVLLGVEEDQLRGRGGRRLAGDGDPGHVHEGARCSTWSRTSLPSRTGQAGSSSCSPATTSTSASTTRSPGCEELRDAPPEERGKLGVFWHTQGSGKTLSMLFFSQKVLRKKPGNWSFVIVTDREDLDEQAHKEFLWAGVLTEKHVRADSSAHLRRLLGEDHRYVFTLIQKFRTEQGEVHPVLSDRDDVIVITDEAHRTQYDILALNMRNALPNASFLGFTGTPLIAGEERTREVFGDYVSIYNFAASTADHATVPLYYENRIPQVADREPHLRRRPHRRSSRRPTSTRTEERQLATTLGQQYELITRDDRLDAVAKDIVEHFLGRGFPGKALVVSIDKVTAVRTLREGPAALEAAPRSERSAPEVKWI